MSNFVAADEMQELAHFMQVLDEALEGMNKLSISFTPIEVIDSNGEVVGTLRYDGIVLGFYNVDADD